MYSSYAGYIILIPADIFKNTSRGIFHVYRWNDRSDARKIGETGERELGDDLGVAERDKYQ